MEDDALVTTLGMVCPFEPAEKQALLEAPDLAERAAALTALLQMDIHAPGTDTAPARPGPVDGAGVPPMTDETTAAPPSEPPPVPVDPRLLEILVCPVTKQPLQYDRAHNELISRAAGLAYPIRDGIPIMLPDEARPLDDG